ncbi:MAG: ATPase, T2SS/T4P/T4SS family [Halieaceae bacterium]|jgi:general secretion pathway protein E|nr:ATPase, T2SS/T4P/T4SS family [Halieaceae bacterium]
MLDATKKIGELLLERGLIQDMDLRKALQLQANSRDRLGTLLVRSGAISEDALLPVLAEQLGMERLQGNDLPDHAAVFEFVQQSEIQLDWFIDHKVALWPLTPRLSEAGGEPASDGEAHAARIEDMLVGCLTPDPLNSFIRETLERFYGAGRVTYFLANQQQVESYADYIRREHAVEDLFQGGDSARALAELAEEAPIIEFVNNMMSQALDAGASDIHVEPGDPNFAVRFRVDGVLHTRLKQPQDRFAAIASRIKLIAGLDIAERRLPQDGSLTTRVSGREMDIRVSTAPDVQGESIVMRLLPKQRDEVSLTQLGMEPDHLALTNRWVREAHGIVLVTGPTGSGKSTTLYSALDASNDGQKKIITVEDPVEYKLQGITQIQAHAEIGYSFARALKAILRQDPDVIMIGEIRDLETAEIAIQSALTGHLVLSTLHTNDAISAFSRLIDMGVEPFLVAAPMLGVQAQRLVRTLCSHCAEPDTISDSLRRDLQTIPGGADVELAPRRAVGCPRCQGTGYKGRSGIYEFVRMTPELHDLVVQGRPVQELRAVAIAQGNRTLRQDGLLKVARGITTLEEVYRVTGTEAEAA